MIAVYCKEKIKPGQKAAFFAHMAEMIRLTHEEDGNIAYDLYEPMDGPDDELAMFELWESKEALDRHMASAHFQKYVPSGDAFKAAPTEIHIYRRP